MFRIAIAWGLIVGVLVAAGYFLMQKSTPSANLTNTYAPTQVSSSTYTYKNATQDDIFISSPKPGMALGDYIEVKGFALGPWYFEAVFPAEVVGPDGSILAKGQAKAQSEWTTEQLVPFIAQLTVTTMYTGPATVILKKDNPSGNPATDAQVSFPIMLQ